MSLTLRMKAQEILDANKLSSLHVGISSHKMLQIQTECGKPVLTITGIVFSRHEPTGKEIEYALELFEAFMVKHRAKITDFIDANKELQELNIPKYKGMREYGNGKIIYEVNDNTSYIFNSNGEIHITATYKSAADFAKAKISATDLKKVNTLLMLMEEKRTLERMVQKLQQDLNSCNI